MNKFRTLFRKEKLETEMTEEMRLHVELQTELNLKAGMKPAEARCAALRQFGNVASIQEQARQGWGWIWLEQTGQDLRYAFRQLQRDRAFTLVVVLTLALGIGATTAIYSVVDRVLLDPVPGPDPDRVVQVGEFVKFYNREELGRSAVAPPVLEALESQKDFFDGYTWCDQAWLERHAEGFSDGIGAVIVPVNFFQFFGVQPVLGRGFMPEEVASYAGGLPTKNSAIVLSHAWWQSEFAGDPAIVGRTLLLGGKYFTVVGVMPAHFTYPQKQTKAWVPGESFRPDPKRTRIGSTRFLARLKTTDTPEQLQAMLDTLAGRLMQDGQAKSAGYAAFWHRAGGLKLWTAPLRLAMQGETYGRDFNDLRRTLVSFLAAIGFVLLIVCANTANLALARTERRQHELAVRAALGAGRGRLMRQLLTENLLLGFAGGLLGFFSAGWGMRLLASFSTLPQLRPIALDGNVLGIALAISLLTVLVFGLAPAWQGGAASASERLKEGGLFATGGARSGRWQRALVVAEVALATVLLIGAGFMVQGVIRLLHVDPGYKPANLLNVGIRIYQKGAPGDVSEINAQRAEVIRRLAALPGVTKVGMLQVGGFARKILTEGRVDPLMVLQSISGVGESDFLQVAGLPLLGGRYFRSDDGGLAGTAVIVNASMAQLCWPGDDAVGKTFRLSDGKDQPLYHVVGVVGDMRLFGLGEVPQPFFYRPTLDGFLGAFPDRIWLRTRSDAAFLAATVRNELKATGFDMAPPVISTVRQDLYDSTQASRTFRNYMMTFAGVGLGLAALGIYGVLAYSVTRRTREIGVRMALGADRAEILQMIIREGARLVTWGVAVGLAAGFLLNRVLQPHFAEKPSIDPFTVRRGVAFHLSPTDPAVVVAVIAVLGAVAFLACWLPARRAAKVDPMVALRAE